MRSKPVASVASGLAAYGLTRETRSCHKLKTRMSTTHRAVACGVRVRVRVRVRARVRVRVRVRVRG